MSANSPSPDTSDMGFCLIEFLISSFLFAFSLLSILVCFEKFSSAFKHLQQEEKRIFDIDLLHRQAEAELEQTISQENLERSFPHLGKVQCVHKGAKEFEIQQARCLLELHDAQPKGPMSIATLHIFSKP